MIEQPTVPDLPVPPPLPPPPVPPPPMPPPTVPSLAPHRGVMILVFGLLGLFGLLPFAAVAWSMANRDLDGMDDGRIDRSGEGLTRAGKTIGAVALIGACVCLGGTFLLMLAVTSALGSF